MTRALIVLCGLLVAGPSLASDEADKARAAGLFAEAQALVESGRHTEACARFEQSVELYAGIGNRFQLADCWERIGRTASAHALFLEVVRATREERQHEREKIATERAEALEAKLSRLRIEVSAPSPDLELSRNGTIVPWSDVGKPVALDPGPYTLCAKGPGKRRWVQHVELGPEPGTLVVTVPALADEEKPGVRTSRPLPVRRAERAPDAPHTDFRRDGLRDAATIGLLGIGAAGIVGGAVMSAQYASSHGDARDVCPTSVGCTQQEIALHAELVEDSRTARTWAALGFGAGALALGGAALLHFTASSGAAGEADARIHGRVFVSRDGALSAALGGRF